VDQYLYDLTTELQVLGCLYMRDVYKSRGCWLALGLLFGHLMPCLHDEPVHKVAVERQLFGDGFVLAYLLNEVLPLNLNFCFPEAVLEHINEEYRIVI